MTHFHKQSSLRSANRCASIVCALLICALFGCGNSIQIEGTQQLLASDAIDKSVAKIDFSPLMNQKVYFDAEYIKTVKGIGFVNADYIISALRQQLVGQGCMMVEDKKEARFIVEARVGALGGNEQNILYGVPEHNALSSAASILPHAPPIPTIPELSLARRSHMSASAKVAVFAYEKDSGESVWQSGTSMAESDARNTWLLGAGPFQKGSIYKGTSLAGEKIRLPWKKRIDPRQEEIASFHKSKTFRNLMLEQYEADTAIVEKEAETAKDAEIQPASHEAPAEAEKKTESAPGKASVGP